MSSPLLPLLALLASLLALTPQSAVASPMPVDLLGARGIFGPDKVEAITLHNALALSTKGSSGCLVDGVVTARYSHNNAILAGTARVAFKAVGLLAKTPEQKAQFNYVTPFFYQKGSDDASVACTIGNATNQASVAAGEHGISSTPFTLTGTDCSSQALPLSSSSAPGLAGAQVQVLQETGFTVISDIDDTIKITEVNDKAKALQNTLINPFRATTGIVDFYARLRTSLNADFIYLSGSPHMLYTPLRDFMRSVGLPAGSLFLNVFGLGLSDLDFYKGSQVHKLKVLRSLLPKYSKRSYVLVGDSAEQDPETYGIIYNEFAAQGVDFKCIYIHKVVGVNPGMEATLNTDDRFAAAFKGVPKEKVFVYSDPSQIPSTADIKNGKCF
ncbi:hypothetical protein BC828DRAFT_370941 [Blastocladiella britannica]|nr:hypothetical protein BC828DRAFT_370941 [Blastocladiella britannica]